ncbi:MAG TPA: hypothetical protein VL501_08205, partial [Pyrinomonadaceae bacterium]|nr:hypothetical protein [Pyrinomonadaceae bacterium]
MRFKNILRGGAVTVGLIVALAAGLSVSAQGRSGQHGGGPPPGAGGPPSGTGVDRGLGTASTKSMGRSNDGLGTASGHSNGRSMTGAERARLASQNANRVSDTDLNRYRGLSKRLDTTPEQLRSAYQAALIQNPDLTFGQFVA